MMRHFFDINAITAMMVVCLTDSTGERTVSQPDKGLELAELTFEVFDWRTYLKVNKARLIVFPRVRVTTISWLGLGQQLH